MNRKLLVSLLYKSIEELEMITNGFMEMDEYPKVILQLAKRKTEDIQAIIEQLEETKPVDTAVAEVQNIEVEEEQIQVSEENTDTVEITEQAEAILVGEKEKVEEVKFIIEENSVEEKIEILEEIDPTPEIAEPEIETIELEKLEEEFEKLQPVETKQVETEPEMQSQEPEISATTIEIKETKEETFIKLTSDEPKVMTLADKIAPSGISRSEKLSANGNSISSTFANKKIDDIKQAISIGDRFRFQRELFSGNGEDMNKTLNYINQLATFEEVSSFLKNKYKWVEEDNDVVDFMQIVKRKFN